MKQFAIIGLDQFGMRMLDELSRVDCEIMILDKNPELVEKVKDRVTAAYIADAVHEEAVRRLVPGTIDAAVLDLGDKIEASILVCNYLKKMGVREIVARADTDQHGEVLYLVGATQVVYPSREAAKRVAPSLISSQLFNYMPLGKGLVVAEIKMPSKYHDKSFIEIDLRRKHGLNVIAMRKASESDFEYFDPEHLIGPTDVYLVAGNEEKVALFTGSDYGQARKGGFSRTLLQIFRGSGRS